MMVRTEKGRQRTRIPVVSSTRSTRMTVRNVYMLPIKNQKSIPSDCAIASLSIRIARGRNKPAELPLDQAGERDRGAVFQIRPDDLHADRQPFRRAPDRHCRGRLPGEGRDARPHGLLQVRVRRAVDINPARTRLTMIVRKGGRRHDRAQYEIELTEHGAPALGKKGARAVRPDPVVVAEHPAAPAASLW